MQSSITGESTLLSEEWENSHSREKETIQGQFQYYETYRHSDHSDISSDSYDNISQEGIQKLNIQHRTESREQNDNNYFKESYDIEKGLNNKDENIEELLKVQLKQLTKENSPTVDHKVLQQKKVEPIFDTDEKEKNENKVQGAEDIKNQKAMFNHLLLSINQKAIHLQSSTFKEKTIKHPNISKQDIISLLSMARQKKQNYYNKLVAWDNERIQILDIHESVMENILFQIDKRLKSSKENFEVYLKFFKDRIKQEQNYLNIKNCNFKKLLQGNIASKNLYSKEEKVFQQLTDDNIEKYKIVQNFVQILKEIIKKMDNKLSQSLKNILKLRQSISKQKEVLQKNTEHVDDTHDEIVALMKCQAPHTKDLYMKTIKYLRRTTRETNVQRKLGYLMMQYYHLAVNSEISRSQTLKEFLITFATATKTTKGKDEIQSQLNKAQQEIFIHQLYSLKEILSQQNFQQLRKGYHLINGKIIQQLTIQNLQNFAKNFKIQSFHESQALLKEFNGIYIDRQTEKQNLCYIVITVDNYLHIFLNKSTKQSYKDAYLSLPLFMKNINIKILQNGNIELKLEQVKNSVLDYIWESKQTSKTHTLKFMEVDKRDQFFLIMQKILK